MRAIDRQRLRDDRQKLRDLRAALRAIKLRRREQVKQIRVDVREARRGSLARVAQLRAEIAKLVRERRQLGPKGRELTAETKRLAAAEIATAAHALAAARGYYLEHLAHPYGGSSRARKGGSVSVREKREQSDHEVEVNVPIELLPVWRAMKHKIHAGPRHSRTEAFFEWVHDHAAEAARLKHSAEEQEADRLWQEHQQTEARTLRSPRARLAAMRAEMPAPPKGPDADDLRRRVHAELHDKRGESKEERHRRLERLKQPIEARIAGLQFAGYSDAARAEREQLVQLVRDVNAFLMFGKKTRASTLDEVPF